MTAALSAAMSELGLTVQLTFASWTRGDRESMAWRAALAKHGKPVLETIHTASADLTPPDPAAVLASLVTNAAVLDFATFEAWAEASNANPDSRQAERIYTALRTEAEALRAAISREGISKLRAAL